MVPRGPSTGTAAVTIEAERTGVPGVPRAWTRNTVTVRKTKKRVRKLFDPMNDDIADDDQTTGDAVEFRCSECNRRVTRSPTGVEYGHVRGEYGNHERCSRRPEEVDPTKFDPKHEMDTRKMQS